MASGISKDEKENIRPRSQGSDFYGTETHTKSSQPRHNLRCEQPGDEATRRHWHHKAQQFSKHDFDQSWAFLQNSINAYAHYMNPYVHYINSNPDGHYTASYATFHVPFIHFKAPTSHQAPCPTQLHTPPLDPEAGVFMPPPRRPLAKVNVNVVRSSVCTETKDKRISRPRTRSLGKTCTESRAEFSAVKSEDNQGTEPKASPVKPKKLVNRFQGQVKDSRQLEETAEQFVRRVDPWSDHGISSWIWVDNPHSDDEDKHADIAGFTREGQVMVDTFDPGKGRGKKERVDAFKHDLLNLASDFKVTVGKWMLFVSPEAGPAIWKKVVQGTIDNRLGTSAKIAAAPYTNKPGDTSRLICIYTKDMDETEDVTRVLLELRSLNVTGSKPIYYKPDALTYLNIYRENGWGMKATLYDSRDVLANWEEKQKICSKKRSSTGIEETTISNKKTKM